MLTATDYTVLPLYTRLLSDEPEDEMEEVEKEEEQEDDFDEEEEEPM